MMKLRRGDFVPGIAVHGLLLMLALILGYNSYKELVREMNPLTSEAKASIKATFLPALLIFSFSYYIASRRKKEKDSFLLGPWRYLFVIGVYALSVNAIFHASGRTVLIPLNFSVFYFSLFIMLLMGFVSFYRMRLQNFVSLREYVPPAVYRLFEKELPRISSHVKKRPASLFITGFSAAMVLSGALLLSGSERAAEEIGKFSFYLLLFGLAVEAYQLVRPGEREKGTVKAFKLSEEGTAEKEAFQEIIVLPGTSSRINTKRRESQ